MQPFKKYNRPRPVKLIQGPTYPIARLKTKIVDGKRWLILNDDAKPADRKPSE